MHLVIHAEAQGQKHTMGQQYQGGSWDSSWLHQQGARRAGRGQQARETYAVQGSSHRAAM